MRAPINLLLLFVLGVAPFGQWHALHAEPLDPDAASSKLSLRLDEPRYHPLKGEDIERIISGKVMSIDSDYEPAPGVKVNQSFVGGCPTKEAFYAGGKWTSYRCDITLRSFSGRWSVEGGLGGQRLCVEAADYPKECRIVWEGPQPNRVIMPVPALAEAGGRMRVYTLYSLNPMTL